MSTPAKMQFRDYPTGFKALAILDAISAAVLFAYLIYGSFTSISITPQEGFVLGSSMKAVITIAFVLALWRYRIRTQGGYRRASVSILLLAIIILWAIPL